MTTDIHTLAGAYALDALTDIERAEFARHVADCQSCEQELAELRATVGRLADATSRTPPPGMKESVLATVAQTPQLPPGRSRDMERRRVGRGWRGWAAAAAAAAVFAAGGVAIGYAVADARVNDAQRVATAAAQDNARINSVLLAGDAQVHSQRVGNGQVTVVVSPGRDEGVALLSNMPAPAANKVYELWLIHSTKPVPAGVMTPGERSGTAFLTNVKGATAFAITEEAPGGTQTPTLPLVTSLTI
jgi:anti-sigma-K factor RskA